jgi:hypothetical protein
MKANFFFFITLIICSQSFATLFQAKESTMEYIISELIELNKAAKTPEFEMASLLNKVEAGAKATDVAAKAVFGGMHTRCESGSKALNGYVTQLKGDLAADGVTVSNAQDALKKAARTQADLKKQLAQGAAGLKRLATRYNKEVTDNQKYSVEASLKTDVIKRLRDIINDELVDGTQAGAFVQIEKFRGTVNELQEKMKNIDDSSIFTPLMSALVGLANGKNFSNQKILNKILGLLAKIDANLTAFLTRHAAEHTKILALLSQQRTLKRKQLNDLQRLNQAATADVNFNNQVVAHAKLTTTLLNAQIAKKGKEAGNWNGLCTAQNAYGVMFLKTVSGFEKSLEALKAATAPLK